MIIFATPINVAFRGDINDWRRFQPRDPGRYLLPSKKSTHQGLRPPSALLNCLITLFMFLALLAALNLAYSLVGVTGVLRNTKGAVQLAVNSEHARLQVNEYAVYLGEFTADPNLVPGVLLACVLIGFISLLPSHVNLVVSRITAGILSNTTTSDNCRLWVFLTDTVIKIIQTLIISVAAFSLFAAMLGGGEFFSDFQNNLVRWLSAVSFSTKQTVIQAAFYSALYLNIWWIVRKRFTG